MTFTPRRERGTFRGWLRAVTRNLMISWLRCRDRNILVAAGANLQELLEQAPAASEPESAEFDLELRRAQFRRAVERIEREVRPATWQAFWETAVVGATAAEAAKKLGMSVGAVRVAKCRVCARLRAVLAEIEIDSCIRTCWRFIRCSRAAGCPFLVMPLPLDGRSDLFSLGCVIYEMATGVSPFRANSILATMRRLVDDNLQAVAALNPELPPWFISIIDRLLEKIATISFGSRSKSGRSQKGKFAMCAMLVFGL